MIQRIRIALSSMALLACATFSEAAPIAITNPGFESPAQVPGGVGSGVATGWTVSGTAGVWYPSSGPAGGFNTAVPQGNQILYAGYTTAGDVSQTLAATVQANTIYTLSFFLGQRNDGVSTNGYSVSLEANGTTVLASDTLGLPAAGTFIQRTITFNSGANPATLSARRPKI
jgi:hypothetical protein